MTALFFVQSLGLGAGLAMDACAVSMSNGMAEPNMPVWKRILIAALFGIFQALMPVIGYFAGHALLDYIGAFIPWIALVLLCFLGGKMIFDGVRGSRKNAETSSESADPAAGANAADAPPRALGFGTLIVQAVATSIDALSVGISIADYSVEKALISAAIIAVVTFAICFAAIFIGRKFGDKLGNRAVIVGGVILIVIGIEICLTGLF